MVGATQSGTMGVVMILVFTLAFPLVLLALPLLMERVERPLRSEATVEVLVRTLQEAHPEELQRLTREGYAPAVERYWRLRRLGSLRLHRSGFRG